MCERGVCVRARLYLGMVSHSARWARATITFCMLRILCARISR